MLYNFCVRQPRLTAKRTADDLTFRPNPSLTEVITLDLNLGEFMSRYSQHACVLVCVCVHRILNQRRIKLDLRRRAVVVMQAAKRSLGQRPIAIAHRVTESI